MGFAILSTELVTSLPAPKTKVPFALWVRLAVPTTALAIPDTLLPAVFDSMLLKDLLMTAPKFWAADPWFVSPSYAFVMME